MKKLSLVALFVAFSLPAAAATADPTLGHRLAKDVCSSCHQIDAHTPPTNKNSGAPSFVDVAKMPSTNERALNVFLRSSHRNMPNIVLSPEEIDSISAYILSLNR